VECDKDTNRAAIGIELEHNGKTVMKRINCKKILCTANVLRNAEPHDKLTLNLQEAMNNNQQQCGNAEQQDTTSQLGCALEALTLCRGREFPYGDSIFELDKLIDDIVFAPVVDQPNIIG
jgi:hypothetical protein